MLEMHTPKRGDVIDGRTVFDVEWYGLGMVRITYASGDRLFDMARPCPCPECLAHNQKLAARYHGAPHAVD